MQSILDKRIFDKIVSLRREIHQYPELSGQEEETANRVARELEKLNIPFQKSVAGHGIVADIEGEKPGPVVALRADLDALPIHEATTLPFASSHDGVMHACGHDGHISMVVGAAMLFREKKRPRYPVRLLFQPAEEIAQGAKALIAEGALENVTSIFGVHIDLHYEGGTIMVTDGYVNAASDKFQIHIAGKSSHAARPHEAVDAVVVGALIVSSLQTIISREIDPAHPAVITVGKFSAGTAANVIAGEAVLEGTIRSLNIETRTYLLTAIQRVAQSVAQLHGAEVNVTLRKGAPALKNSKEQAQMARRAAERTVGVGAVVEKSMVNMGGEDFSYFLEKVPGAVVRIGGKFANKKPYPAHSSQFDFDETALAVGARYLYEVVHIASHK